MPKIRLDQVIFSTLHPAYLNYRTDEAIMEVDTSSIPDGDTMEQNVVVPTPKVGTRADIYASNGTVSTLVSSGGRAAASVVYTYASTEVARIDIEYGSYDIYIYLRITNNTGGPISPPAQTLTFSVVQYDAPISTI